jgi:hypothetical protein
MSLLLGLLLAGVAVVAMGMLMGLLYLLLFVWAIPATVVGAGLGCLTVAEVKARREGRAARTPRPHCADCGAAVPTGAAVCPRCGGVRVGAQPGGRRWERSQATAMSTALRAAGGPTAQPGRIGWLPPAGFAALSWYVRGLVGAHYVYVEPASPEALRWWASRLLLIGGLLAALVAAGEIGTWLAALPVLGAGAGSSIAIARRGTD